MSDAGVKQRGDQQRTSADMGGAPRGLVKKAFWMSARSPGLGRGSAATKKHPALPRSTPTPTLPQDTGEGVQRRAAATQNTGEGVRRARVSVKKASEPEARRGCW